MMRIGHSRDLHRLKAGKRLILGGIEIESAVESVGHSDADCLLHTVAESLYGALALGDLGTFFPDTSDAYKGLDSQVIVKDALKKIRALGYKVNNIDSMIMLESPKLRNYIDAIRLNISQLLEIDISQVSVKATTEEGIGLVGEGKAIVCETMVLVEKENRNGRNDAWQF